MAAERGVERNQIEKFLTTCIEMAKSDEMRQTLKDPSSGRPGAKLVELQKRIWENLGVPTAAGRAAVGRIEQLFPESQEALIALREEFGRTVDAAYMQCLEDRRPSMLKKKGKLPRNTVLEFFDACNLKLDGTDAQERLRKHINDTGAMPDLVVNEIHDEVMELLGFDREHGQRCFKEMGTANEFEHDREIAMSYARWKGKTRSVCLRLLNEYRKNGGELNVEKQVQDQLFEVQAQDELRAMSLEARNHLLEKNAKKVNVIRGLPPEGRNRYVEKLGEDEKLDVFKTEILMEALMQSQHQTLVQGSARREE